jgi:ClpP class serine protease
VKRYAIRIGECYAMQRSVLDTVERDSAGFFISFGSEPTPNEARGTVAVVHIRGALAQFRGEGGDSYEDIIARVTAAVTADPKPTALVLAISSPGGLVAGLNETVFALQRLRVASGVPFIAQINELAASAAFALCCACDRRFAPASGIAGSIGTISTMASQHRRDVAEGIDYVIITSGERKADGHPHQPISTAAIKAEKARNDQLAEQFFALAAKALRASPRKLAALQASIYVGENALKVGLINAVQSLDETIAGLDRSDSASPPPAPNEGNITDRRAKERTAA